MIDLKTHHIDAPHSPDIEIGTDYTGRLWVRIPVGVEVGKAYLTVGASEDRFKVLTDKRMTLTDFFSNPESGVAYLIQFRDEDRLGAYVESTQNKDTILDWMGNIEAQYLN